VIDILDRISGHEFQPVFRSWIEGAQAVIDANRGYLSCSTFWLSLFRSKSAPLWLV
jgi:hypothetical protein